jgi:hemerythrin
MIAIAWNKERMTTGVEEIDKQHQELIRHFNAFHNALAQGRAKEIAVHTMAFVADYAEWHFKKEEACMRDYRCPAAGANLAAHNALRMELTKGKSRVKNGQMETVDLLGLNAMLGNWIQDHICILDVKLRETLKSAGCPGP